MIVGTAEIDILAIAPGFNESLKKETEPGFSNFKGDAKTAGEDAGAGLRTGVRAEAGRLEGDLGEAGLASGAALRSGMKDGTSGIEGDLAGAGVAGGAGLREGVKDGSKDLESDLGNLGGLAGGNLRKGVEGETGKLADDLEKDGKDGGERLSKGLGTGLSKVANLVSSTGLPLGGLTSGLEKAGGAADHLESKSSGLMGTLDRVGGVALVGVGVAAAGAAVETVKLAEGMETADTKMASAEGQGAKFGKTVGDAFLSTSGKAEYSGKEMATAFAGVAGQLKATEGHALSAGESYKFMAAAGDLTTATQGQLGSVTETVSKVMQTFQMHTSEAAHAADVLYSASNLTGVSVETLGGELSKVRGKLGETAGSVGNLATLLVDMKEQGISGRGAMTGLSTGLNTLLKGSEGVAAATQQQNTAYEAMSPALKKLAKEYESGSISAEAFKKTTSSLPPQQAGLAESFAKASTAVQTAQLKYKEMGLTVFDTQGKFVGMGSIIEQLGPRFAKMNQEQQLAAATTLFGAGAAKQMTAIIVAGIPGYQKASAAVERHAAAQKAAEAQSKTLHDQEKALGVQFDNVAVIVGQVLIPIVTKMVSVFVSASSFVLAHKAILIGLAAVITGVLGTAIAVFTVNKMVAFGQSFSKASGVVKSFANDVETAVSKVIARFTAQEAATEKLAATTAESSGQMELDFAGTGGAATAAEGEIASASAGEASAVATADTAIEADNVAAGASFTAMLGPIAAVAAAVVALDNILPAGERPENLLGGNQPGESSKEGEVFAKSHGYGNVGEQIVTYFEKQGFSSNAAKGIAGNTALESSDNPNAPGGGLFQDIGGRGAGQGASLQAQLEAADRELRTTYHGVFEAIQKAKSPQEAAKLFEEGFEKPEGYNKPGEGGTAHSLQRERAAAEAHGEHAHHSASTSAHAKALQQDSEALGKHSSAVGENTKAHHAKTKASGPSVSSIVSWAEKAVGKFPENLGHDQGTELDKLQSEFHTRAAAWCAEFATTAAMMGGANKAVRTASVATIREWAEQGSHGYRKGLTGKPQSGDLMLFGDKHVGFVQSVSQAAGTVTTIEGNTKQGSGAVRRETHKISEGDYAQPAYHKIEAGGNELREVSKRFEAAAKAEQKRMADDQKAGNKALNTLLGAEHATSLKTLDAALEKAHKEGVGNMVKDVHGIHQKGLGSIEKKLDEDHTKALAKLSRELVEVHKKALEHEATLVAKAVKEAWEKSMPGQVAAWEKSNREQRELEAAEANSPEGKRLAAEEAAKKASEEQTQAAEKAEQEKIAAIDKQSTIETDIASNKAQEIGDATKIMLDKQAEVGLSGTAEIAAHLQTVYDELTGNMDQAIGAAKLAQDETVGKGAVAEAEAAARTAKIEAEAKVKEAEAQKALEIAKMTAGSSSAGTGINIESLVINGAGMSSAELTAELGWSLKTGALPTAQITPVAA